MRRRFHYSLGLKKDVKIQCVAMRARTTLQQKPAKKRYEPPRLNGFGDMRVITLAVGNMGAKDSAVGMGTGACNGRVSS